MEFENARFWLALLHLSGVGPVFYRQLVDEYGDPRYLFDNPGILPDNKLAKALRHPDWEAVERDLEWAQQSDCHLLPLTDPRYPAALRAIHDAPPLLFVRGTIEVLGYPQLAMVGSRNPTAGGKGTAKDFARTLSRAGLVITSGLALGIDTLAHQGALEGGEQTVAVAGTGLDRIYPASNRQLAHTILDKGGAIISEYPTGTPPHAGNFPRRNRIISGLSLGTLVVEAALRSGSLITARMAMEQGREVFAIPGSIHNPLARGCHQLIRQGAKLVESAADILEELAPQLHLILQVESEPADEPAELDAEYRHLLSSIDYDVTAVDTMVERCGLTAEVVSSMLLALELQGFIESTPGGYVRTPKRF